MPVPPVPRVPAEALASLPEPVTACPQCGFLGIGMPSVAHGGWVGGGEIAMAVCPRCRYQGQALSFRKRDDYAAFVAELHGEPLR